MSPSTRSLRSRIASARYGPRIVELFHSALWSVAETTYFGDSFMDGAPGSSSAVRPDQAGANISKVPPQEQRLAGSHDCADGLPHLGIERVVHRPARLVDDAI